MLTESGRIVAVNEHSIWVETIQQSTCGQCAARKGCGQSMLHKLYDGRRHHIEVPLGDYSGSLRVNDIVEIGIPEELMVKGSLLLYLLPIVLMLSGAVLLAGSDFLSSELGQDPAAIMGAVGGFALGMAVNKVINIRHRSNPALNPRLLGCQSQLLRAVEQ